MNAVAPVVGEKMQGDGWPDVRIEIKIKNNLLYRQIYKSFNSVSEFCGCAGLSKYMVFGFLSLRVSPVTKHSRRKSDRLIKTHTQGYFWKKSASKIATALQVSEFLIFPEHFWSEKNTTRSIEVDYKQLEAEWAACNMPEYSGDEEDRLINSMCPTFNIDKILKTLTPIEDEVVRMRFGFGYDESTLSRVGEMIGISKERVRQIEARALRKMRHPSRKKYLILEET